MSLELKDGKFFRDGNPEPLKFGDKEQIKLMTERIETIKALNGEGLLVHVDLETTYTAYLSFKCTCGVRLNPRFEIESERHYHLNGEIFICHSCKAKYVVNQDKDGMITVKSRP